MSKTSATDAADQETQSPWPRLPNGTLLIVGLVVVLVAGWFFYRTTIPAAWLRDFGAAIALHASADNAPTPEDTRQATPRGTSSSPYICVARAIRLDWDRMVVLTPSAHDAPVLAGADWSQLDAKHSLDQLERELTRDPRYQAIVLLKDNHVIAAELFYTFWADLSALARPDGFGRDDAVFTAKVQNGTYVLAIPADIPADACG